MDNIQDDKRETWFIDVDGTLVLHNYRPEETDDVFISGAVEKLKSLQDGAVIILTTSRTEKQMESVMRQLKMLTIRIDGLICNLPTGSRILVNDTKVEEDGSAKTTASAMILERNKGWT